jgi:hypothetical protein
MNENKAYWDEHLPTILFFYKTTCKVATRHIPYQLLYELHPLMPIEMFCWHSMGTTNMQILRGYALVD